MENGPSPHWIIPLRNNMTIGKSKITLLVLCSLIMAMSFPAFFTLEKNESAINGPREKLQAIEQATDIVQTRRTAKRYIDFGRNVHESELTL